MLCWEWNQLQNRRKLSSFQSDEDAAAAGVEVVVGIAIGIAVHHWVVQFVASTPTLDSVIISRCLPRNNNKLNTHYQQLERRKKHNVNGQRDCKVEPIDKDTNTNTINKIHCNIFLNFFIYFSLILYFLGIFCVGFYWNSLDRKKRTEVISIW